MGENKKTQLQLPIILIDMKVVRARGKINPCFFFFFFFSPRFYKFIRPWKEEALRKER